MINYYTNVNGVVQKLDNFEENCWINVVAPNHEEISSLTEQFKLEPDFIRACLDPEESSRIETEEENTLIIIDAPVADSKNSDDDFDVVYSTSPFGIIVTPSNVITMSLNESVVLTEFSRGFVKNVSTHLKTRFVLQLMLRVSIRFLYYLKQIDKLSSSLERQLRKSMKNKELIELLDVQKSLVYFSTSLKSDETTIEKLTKGKYLKMYEEDLDLLEDVLIEIKQAIEMSGIYLNIMSGTMDAFASVISNNLNIVMKILASLTVVTSIPTIVTGFYGMNIPSGLPFDNAYWPPILISGILMAAVGWFLYKKNMF